MSIDFTSQYDRHYAAVGRAATYTRKGEAAVDVTVRTEFDGEDSKEAAMTIKVRRAEVAARPGYGDTFVVDGETWTVERVLDKAGGTNAYQWAVQAWSKRRAVT